MTATTPARTASPRLHIPDEPAVRRELWLDAVLGGATLHAVLESEDGIVEWLWRRWRALERSGMGRDGLAAVVLAYRREVWLWLVGERTWEQCCSGLLGRIDRRLG